MPPGRRLVVSAVLILLGTTAPARVSAASPADDDAIELLALSANGAPAEFAADLSIRIAESPNFHDAARRRELLESAFMRAYGAQESFARTAPMAPVDTPDGGLTRAYATGLDTLTLQLRATVGMIPIDPARAREMFEWIDFYLPKANCDTRLVPIADDYYTALSAIVQRTFGDSIDDRGDALRFFELYLWRTHLPSEIPILARAVRALKLPRVDAGYIEGTLNAIMDRVETDPRGFSSFGQDIVTRMTELADANRGEGVLGETAMRATRKLLAAQLSAARCADSAAEGPIAETFNAILRRKELTRDLVTPLDTSQLRPAKVLPAAPMARYWRSPDARRLLDALQRLRDLANSMGPAKARTVKQSAEWQGLALRFLGDVDLWNGSREPNEREYFDQKCLLYDAFMNDVLPGPLRTRTARSWVDFLRRADTGRLPRAAWMANLRRLFDHGDPATLPALTESGHYLLTMYAQAERLLGNIRRDP